MSSLPKPYEYNYLPAPYSNVRFTNVVTALLLYMASSALKTPQTFPEEVPLWHKYSLNYSEASAYFGIGEKRLRQLVSEHPNSDFILEIGTHIRFKRVMFEDYLNTVGCV